MRRLKGMLTLMRPDLSVAAGVCVVLGQMLALGRFAGAAAALLGFISVACVSGAILVVNDYFDVETDAVNAPHRPIPSGAVSRNEAGIFAIVLTMLGAGSAYALGALPLAVFFLLGVIGFVYNRWMKKSGLWGNLMVSFSVGMTFIYGGITAGLPFEKTVVFFAVLSGLLDLGEEVAADAMDAEGDKKIGSRSIAILYGKAAALNVSSAMFACVVVLSILPFFMGWFSPAYLVPILLMDAVIVFSVIKLRGTTGSGGRKYIKFIYQSGTAAIIIFLVMRLLGV